MSRSEFGASELSVLELEVTAKDTEHYRLVHNVLHCSINISHIEIFMIHLCNSCPFLRQLADHRKINYTYMGGIHDCDTI